MDGKTQRIGADRSLVLDLLRWSNTVPSFPVERRFDLREVETARSQAIQRISWTALFARAYGLASRQHPQLRQIYVGWPWPRVYQSGKCVISISVNRTLGDTERLFWGRLRSPDVASLPEIQTELDRFRTGEPARVFRSQWRGARMPGLVRRAGWWWRMAVDYRSRPRRVGTGSISTLAGQGVTNRLHPCLLTTSLSFGPVEEDGRCLVTLQCDHRVLDGMVAARALQSIGQLLTGQVLDELRGLAAGTAGEIAGQDDPSQRAA